MNISFKHCAFSLAVSLLSFPVLNAAKPNVLSKSEIADGWKLKDAFKMEDYAV